MIHRPRTLRGRLAMWYAAVLAIVLLVYSGALYFIAILEDDVAAEARGHEAEINMAGHQVLLGLMLGLPMALAVAVGGGMWIARRALAPIDEVVGVASELGVEHLERRIKGHGDAGEEVGRLVSAFNAMLERLEFSVGGMRRFTADASHELRTPIAAVVGNLGVALRRERDAGELREAIAGALEELGDLTRLIDSLLMLARADAGELVLERVTVDVSEIAGHVLDAYQSVAAERGLVLPAAPLCGVQVHVQADPIWLGRAIANLLDNACKFTPRGGRVDLLVEAVDGRARVTVSDTGPGITEDEGERVFERFYRGTVARGSSDGFGLGLPLARDIVRGMGGDLLAFARPEGGARFCIELPAV